jgi:predicted DNA-binding transcriptional regulator AlpA
MIYQMEADLRFPKRIKIGTRAVGWLEADVFSWLQQRIEISRASATSSDPRHAAR